jgi:hypothetical protein
MWPRALPVALVFCLASGVPFPSRAADEAVKVADSAKAHYKQGRTHYQLGEYREALKEFQEAYRLKQDASFLFNIAQCHRQLHEVADAIKLYGSYLREAPDAANRAEVERQIRELKVALDQQQQQEQAAAALAAQMPTPAPIAPAVPEPGAAPAVAQSAASMPAPVPTPAPPSRALEMPRDAELEVNANPPEANILVNHISVGASAPVKLRLPPGLYSVALERDGFRGAAGAVTLIAGDHTAVMGKLSRVKSHGWRGLGHLFLVLTAVGEAGAIVGHVKANRSFAGSDDFNKFSAVEKGSQAAAISAATLTVACYVLDWLVNRDKVDAGPPGLLQPMPRETE